jgi:hypothetical protein
MADNGQSCKITLAHEIQEIEGQLPSIVLQLLEKIRKGVPVYYYDQRNCPYPDYRDVATWFQPYPARDSPREYRIWVDRERLGTELSDHIAHEVGHAMLHRRGIRGLQYRSVRDTAQDIANRVGDMLEDPWVEALLKEYGLNRSLHDEGMVQGFVSYVITLLQRYHRDVLQLEAHLCHRYVVTKLEIGEQQFEKFGLEQLWRSVVQCDDAKRKAAEVYEYLRKNPPKDWSTYRQAACVVSKILQVSDIVYVPT